MQHVLLGREGEELAVEYLLERNFEILDRNYRFGRGELDIVCKHLGCLIIVEVKTRKSNYYGEPHNSITLKKQRQIIQIANRYIQQKEYDLDVRFDIISIIHNQNKTSIEHIANAFSPQVS